MYWTKKNSDYTFNYYAIINMSCITNFRIVDKEYQMMAKPGVICYYLHLNSNPKIADKLYQFLQTCFLTT